MVVLVCDRQVARNMKVRVGSYHLYAEDEGQTDIAVSTIHLHPDYDAWTLDHDLCILALAHKVELQTNLREDYAKFYNQSHKDKGRTWL